MMKAPGWWRPTGRGSSNRSPAARPRRRSREREWDSRLLAVYSARSRDESGPRRKQAAHRSESRFRPIRGPSWWRDAMSMRVLIVDDEPAILAAMAPLLRSRGYDVSTAMSGRGALDAVEKVQPDL